MNETITSGRLELGKVDYNGTGRGISLAVLTWSLKAGETGPEFSACGEIWDGPKTDCLSCGQCVEEVAALFPHNKKAQRILAIWKAHHLNGMKAGLPVQEQAVAEWADKGNRYDYEAVCAMLRGIGLYEVPVPEGAKATGGFPDEVASGKRGYRYGERWIYAPIPQDVIDEIKSL